MRHARLFSFIVIWCVLGCGVWGCSGAPATEEAKKPVKPGVPVSVATAERRNVPIELRAIGNVESYATVAVKARINGEVHLVHFEAGQDVRQGDPLFTIDKRPFEAALREATAKLERDKTLSAKADEDVRRFSSLVGKGFVSIDQYESFKSTAEALHASIRANQAAEAKASLDLDYCFIRAPLNGRTGQILAFQGAMIKANDDNKAMVVIDQIEPIYVTFSVPEAHLPAIQERMRAGRPTVTGKPPSAPFEPERGVLTFIDSNVDARTGAIKLKGVFINKERRLWPGQFVDVVLELGEEKDAVVLPTQAVQNGLEGLYAFVIGPDNVAQLRQVKTGRTMGGFTVIALGVAAGERVVTDGQLRLAPYALVEIKSEIKSGGEAAQ